MAERILTPEEYAKEFTLDLEYVHRLCAESLPRKKCPKKFDERDVIRYSQKVIRLVYQPPNATGFFRPRLLDRP